MKVFFALVIVAICSVFAGYGFACYYAYFYPMEYRETIVNFGEKYSVSGGLIASIANVESHFDENAVSSKGAVGIMQLIPSSAQWLAGKIGVEFDQSRLKDAEYNLQLGTYYLSFLMKTFKDEKVAICAYNAGQGNVSAWLNDTRYSKDGKTLQDVPFPETKAYLKKVLINYNYYKNKYN